MTPVRATFQTKFFLAALSASVIALAVAGLLFATTMRRETNERIEATLVSEARMAADLLAHDTSLTTVRRWTRRPIASASCWARA